MASGSSSGSDSRSRRRGKELSILRALCRPRRGASSSSMAAGTGAGLVALPRNWRWHARVVLPGVILAATALPADAQWSVEGPSGNAIARAVGLDGRIRIIVACSRSNHTVTLRLAGDAAFAEGDVETRWDDGSTEKYSFQDEAGALRGSVASAEIRAFIEKLSQRRSVRLLGINALGEEVTDRISLTGSARAIDALPCSPSARQAARRAPSRSDAEIRRILVRQSIAGYSGSCPCPYNTDRAGRRCGRRSAYSRPGGASPLCYPGDVSDAAVEAYRARTGR